ncbi:hypothetical protein MRX96_002989 [Rhipicephalus microplus]
MTDEPADPPGDFSGTTSEPITRTVDNHVQRTGPARIATTRVCYDLPRKQSMSMLPCARASRHQTFKKIPRTLAQDSVLLRSLRFLGAPSSLTAPGMRVL